MSKIDVGKEKGSLLSTTARSYTSRRASRYIILTDVLSLFLNRAMDKDTFLRLQYLRMINSEDFVAEVWRSSINRFLADMWDRTPNNQRQRFLAPIDPSLGFAPDNVEWQFPKIKKRRGKQAKALVSEPERKTPTAAERRESKQAAREAAVEERRRAIAEEFARWEAIRAKQI